MCTSRRLLAGWQLTDPAARRALEARVVLWPRFMAFLLTYFVSVVPAAVYNSLHLEQGIFHPSPLGSCLTALGMLHGAFNFGVFWSNHSAVSQTWRDCLHLLRPSRPSDVSLFEPLTAAWDKESMASSGSTSPVSALMADAPRSWRTPAGLVLLPPARAP